MLPPDYFPARTARDQSLNLTIWIARPQTMFCLTATLRQKLIKCLLLPHSNPLVNTCILQPGRADVWIWSHAMLTLEWPTNLIKFKKKKKKKTSLQRHRKRDCLSILRKYILLLAVWFSIVGDTHRRSNLALRESFLWMIGQQRSSRHLELIRESSSHFLTGE